MAAKKNKGSVKGPRTHPINFCDNKWVDNRVIRMIRWNIAVKN